MGKRKQDKAQEMICSECKHYREWQEYGETFSDCYYNESTPQKSRDVDHINWFLSRTDELEDSDKSWKEVAKECDQFAERCESEERG